MTISATATEFIITGPEPSILSVLLDGVLYDTFNNYPSIAPIATQNVSAGANVTITAIGSDGENDTLTYTFRQISGTSVTLSQTGATATFTAPSDANTHSIVIGVIANDGELDSAEVTTTVNIAASSFDDFVVETGTGIENANALVSVVELDAYASSRNISVATFTVAQKQGAIVTASVDYCDTYFVFPGDPLNIDQGMQIPTVTVPLNSKIKSAIAAAALLHLQGRLFVDPSEIGSKAVISESDSVGPVSTSRTYSETQQFLTKYPTTTIDRILNKYAVGSGLGGVLRG